MISHDRSDISTEKLANSELNKVKILTPRLNWTYAGCFIYHSKFCSSNYKNCAKLQLEHGDVLACLMSKALEIEKSLRAGCKKRNLGTACRDEMHGAKLVNSTSSYFNQQIKFARGERKGQHMPQISQGHMLSSAETCSKKNHLD